MASRDHILILININILVLMVILWLPGRFPLYRGNIHWNIKELWAMMPAIYGTETPTNGNPDTRASRSIVVYFYNFYVHLKLFQNKMFKRCSCAIGCFVTWI